MKNKASNGTFTMNRRGFLKVGTQATVLGALGAGGPTALAATGRPANELQTPALLRSYTADDHRRRLQNIALGERGVRACLRKHLITDYLPGQCCYNLGEYPCRKPWEIGEFDERELDALRDHGIRLIQLHEEWHDALRLFGAHKFAPLNPAGFRRFVEMVHKRGMKLIVYASSGFFQRTDPDFREEWATGGDHVAVGHSYAFCRPESTGWRAYVLPQLVRLLDDYGVDGIYNDLGYILRRPAQDGVSAFEESATKDGALGDLLAMIYAEVHRRGGIVKVHRGGLTRPQTELKVYDYLWIGEGVDQVDRLRDAVKNHPPYVVPCLDMSRTKIGSEDELYLHAIPYMQFPLLLAGHPFTGERALIPGVKYTTPDGFWDRRLREMWKYYQANPNAPRSYGWWDSFPGRPDARATHARWLRHYLPMVEEGTWAWLEISDSDLFTQPPPKDVVASAFANREFHLVLANYGNSSVQIITRDFHRSVADAAAGARKEWTLGARSIHILQRTNA